MKLTNISTRRMVEVDRAMTHAQIGAFAHLPHEVLVHHSVAYTSTTDMYCIGIIMWEMWTRSFAFRQVRTYGHGSLGPPFKQDAEPDLHANLATPLTLLCVTTPFHHEFHNLHRGVPHPAVLRILCQWGLRALQSFPRVCFVGLLSVLRAHFQAPVFLGRARL